MDVVFDTHAHLDDPRYDEDRELVISRMREAGVSGCATIGADMPTSRAAAAIAQRTAGVVAAVGIHPHEAKTYTVECLDEIKAMLGLPWVRALGEIGLDYYYDLSPRDAQKTAFAAQLELAVAENVPVIFHVREAHEDAYEIMALHKKKLPPCVMHCFSGSYETAKRFLDLGLMISLAGPVTFKNARVQHDVAKRVPLERLMCETDSPYMSPEPFRGKRNEPARVVFVAEMIASLRAQTDERSTVLDALDRNARKFYRTD